MKYISKKDIILPKRSPIGHKGDNGYLLIIGGSHDYVGAVTLAGLAALRSGCDLVTIAAPERVAWAVALHSPDLISHKLEGRYIMSEHLNELKTLSKKFDVLLIGNGMSFRQNTKEVVDGLLSLPQKKVFDADAIKALSLKTTKNAIITPHKKELLTLIRNSLSVKEIRQFYDKNKFVVTEKNCKIIQNYLKNTVMIIKGKIDIIITPDHILYNKTGNAGMTKAGTGDVLAGLAAGFLAQGLSLEQAAINAVFINGMIGDKLLKEREGCYSYIASDLVKDITEVLGLL